MCNGGERFASESASNVILYPKITIQNPVLHPPTCALSISVIPAKHVMGARLAIKRSIKLVVVRCVSPQMVRLNDWAIDVFCSLRESCDSNNDLCNWYQCSHDCHENQKGVETTSCACSNCANNATMIGTTMPTTVARERVALSDVNRRINFYSVLLYVQQ
jgi:hypothetical protein